MEALRTPKLAKNFTLDIRNRFDALVDNDDAEESWTTFSSTIHESVVKVISYKQNKRKPWLSDEAHLLVEEKAKARQQGDRPARNRLK